ncbi:MAG: antibiotic biosynthesis monooxygenase [Planctomycetota bacterium]|nr:antibiotic biosynthesis monooxygenase [Planctomycetota bacterium]
MRRRTWMIAAGAALGTLAGGFAISGCTIATPFKGPGYSRGEGVTLAGVGSTVVVSVTHARVERSKRAVFDQHSARVVRSMGEHDGLIGYSVRRELLGDGVWTMTVWRDRDAVLNFANTRVHTDAMGEGLPAVKEMHFLRFECPTREAPPSWTQALARLDEDIASRAAAAARE